MQICSKKKKYKLEIENNKETSLTLNEIINDNKIVTLLYGAKDEEHNEAIVLADWLGGVLTKHY